MSYSGAKGGLGGKKRLSSKTDKLRVAQTLETYVPTKSEDKGWFDLSSLNNFAVNTANTIRSYGINVVLQTFKMKAKVYVDISTLSTNPKPAPKVVVEVPIQEEIPIIETAVEKVEKHKAPDISDIDISAISIPKKEPVKYDIDLSGIDIKIDNNNKPKSDFGDKLAQINDMNSNATFVSPSNIKQNTLEDDNFVDISQVKSEEVIPDTIKALFSERASILAEQDVIKEQIAQKTNTINQKEDSLVGLNDRLNSLKSMEPDKLDKNGNESSQYQAWAEQVSQQEELIDKTNNNLAKLNDEIISLNKQFETIKENLNNNDLEISKAEKNHLATLSDKADIQAFVKNFEALKSPVLMS